MCFVCEDIDKKDKFQYEYTIEKYEQGELTLYDYAIRHYEESDEYILYVRSDSDADMQVLPIKYCPFCGDRLH